ncbi:hypothetical protein ACFU99_36800 [Streptomyces sp. NPDC057654]|uniref:hypothetical protein n=1 Tax=Streptomyces sp. NPDC057654 TaxID=3346196 RepID=UPI00369243D6
MTRCGFEISPETLRRARVPDKNTAHARGLCARLWADEQHRRNDAQSLSGLADQEVSA